jgi:hypothetical protein
MTSSMADVDGNVSRSSLMSPSLVFFGPLGPSGSCGSTGRIRPATQKSECRNTVEHKLGEYCKMSKGWSTRGGMGSNPTSDTKTKYRSSVFTSKDQLNTAHSDRTWFSGPDKQEILILILILNSTQEDTLS